MESIHSIDQILRKGVSLHGLLPFVKFFDVLLSVGMLFIVMLQGCYSELPEAKQLHYQTGDSTLLSLVPEK